MLRVVALDLEILKHSSVGVLRNQSSSVRRRCGTLEQLAAGRENLVDLVLDVRYEQ